RLGPATWGPGAIRADALGPVPLSRAAPSGRHVLLQHLLPGRAGAAAPTRGPPARPAARPGPDRRRRVAVGRADGHLRQRDPAARPAVRGFLIHSRGARSAPISQAPQASPASMPAVVRTRTDIGTPVLTVESQTDILAAGIGYLPATQPDSRWFRL